jgi:hypothetical protein
MNLASILKYGVVGLASLLAILICLDTRGGGEPSTVNASVAAEAATLRTAVRKSDYVFRGVVTQVQYRESDRAPGKEQIPHTFVTFKVEEPLKGGKQETITLRFAGGPDARGRTLLVSDVPRFDVGERSILLVKNNGKSYCPLVDCDVGRFRVIQDKVYSNDGLAVTLNGRGEVTHSDLLTAKEALEDKVGNKVFGSVYSKTTQAGDSGGAGAGIVPEARKVAPAAIGQAVFSSVIRQAGKDASARTGVVSVNIRDKFYIDAPKPVSPQSVAKTQPPAPQPRNAQEREELKLLKQQQEQDLKVLLGKER